MARLSTIKRLPPELRELIAELRDQGQTIDAILEKLRELQVDVSRSALGRHVKQIDAIGEEIRRSRTIAEALVKRYGEQPENRTARLNIELMHAFISKLMVSDQGDIVSLDAKEAMFVATALQKLAQAAKQDVDREGALREQFREKVDAKLKAIESDLAGADEDGAAEASRAAVLKRIREDVYGIFS